MSEQARDELLREMDRVTRGIAMTRAEIEEAKHELAAIRSRVGHLRRPRLAFVRIIGAAALITVGAFCAEASVAGRMRQTIWDRVWSDHSQTLLRVDLLTRMGKIESSCFHGDRVERASMKVRFDADGAVVKAEFPAGTHVNSQCASNVLAEQPVFRQARDRSMALDVTFLPANASR